MVGIVGCIFKTALPEATDVQPDELVTVKVYVVLAVKPVTEPVVPDPVVLPEGEPVTVQVPDAGKPLNATLPVDTEHEGCVIVPTIGALGIVLIVALVATFLLVAPVDEQTMFPPSLLAAVVDVLTYMVVELIVPEDPIVIVALFVPTFVLKSDTVETSKPTGGVIVIPAVILVPLTLKL